MSDKKARNISKPLSAGWVFSALRDEYGHVEWKPGGDPALELLRTILSQHTSDINSHRAFDNLMQAYKSLDVIANAPVSEIEDIIRTGGLAGIKAARIKAVLSIIKQKTGNYDIGFFRDMELSEAKKWLQDLPGVGPKTAAVVLCFSLGLPAMPVDTHIFRVAKRLSLIKSRVNATKAHELLEALVSPVDVFAFHMYLIWHGRRVCKALRPLCDRCVLASGCPSCHLFIQCEQ